MEYKSFSCAQIQNNKWYAKNKSTENEQKCTKFRCHFSNNAKIRMVLLGRLDTFLNGTYNMVNVSKEMLGSYAHRLTITRRGKFFVEKKKVAKVKKAKLERLGTKEIIQSYLMIAGNTIGLIVFVVIPLLWVVRFCTMYYKGYGTMRFVGLENFIRVFERSPKFWLSVKNTFVFATFKLAVEIPLALVLAFLLTRKLKGTDFFRSVFFMPSMISVAIMGVVFSYLFSHESGIINGILKSLGGTGVKWFASGTTAMIVLMIASIWQNFGINMLFFMTGLQSISPEMYEAASIDGASNTRQFFTITIPLLGPVLQMVLMNAILGSLKVTDLVMTLTNGAPNGKTEVMMTYIYRQFFSDGVSNAKQFGYGAALTVVVAVILSIVTIIYLRTTKKTADVY